MTGVSLNTGADRPYFDALAQGRLSLPRCAECRRWRWPAVFRCPDCGAWEQAWEPAEMAGTIFTWTRTWHPFGGTEGIGTPFVSLVVALDAPKPIRLTGVLEGAEEGLAIGARVIGRAASTRFGDQDIPAIRWILAR